MRAFREGYRQLAVRSLVRDETDGRIASEEGGQGVCPSVALRSGQRTMDGRPAGRIHVGKYHQSRIDVVAKVIYLLRCFNPVGIFLRD